MLTKHGEAVGARAADAALRELQLAPRAYILPIYITSGEWRCSQARASAGADETWVHTEVCYVLGSSTPRAFPRARVSIATKQQPMGALNGDSHQASPSAVWRHGSPSLYLLR